MSLISFQWWRVGTELYLDNRVTANEMSGLIH